MKINNEVFALRHGEIVTIEELTEKHEYMIMKKPATLPSYPATSLVSGGRAQVDFVIICATRYSDGFGWMRLSLPSHEAVTDLIVDGDFKADRWYGLSVKR